MRSTAVSMPAQRAGLHSLRRPDESDDGPVMIGILLRSQHHDARPPTGWLPSMAATVARIPPLGKIRDAFDQWGVTGSAT